MLQLQEILPDTLELLRELSAQAEMRGMRLVGGTSLALQFGHRQNLKRVVYWLFDFVAGQTHKRTDYIHVNNFVFLQNKK